MPRNPGVPEQRDAVQTLLEDVTFDLNSIDSFEQALTNIPDGETIAVTLAPKNGIEPTIERSVSAATQGYDVVPHIGARFISDRDELDEIAQRLLDADITNIFVPGGDLDEPVGDFSSAYELLVALDELGHSFEEVGIGGYPTGHEFLEDSVLRSAMEKKKAYATYIVTQLSFDSTAIIEWINRIRNRGIELPVEVGIPGVMNYWQLMSLCRRWGIAEPLQFLRKTTGFVGFATELIRAKGKYKPDELIDDLSAYVDDEQFNIGGLRLYTFNQTATTEAWRQSRLNGA
ncbi:methylenetetrahydrofolate reductase [Natrarchaeobius chitinivorans]|uniref:Methylenetetrahydrofolate reductase n=1 Tax=Natrarchaeobius chitinivorans TaxID=1679083 RepID=A0A3N6M141_NATCH|nr:methylenetetrahydrofolate reductase [Natrarchaeobius chitinivorans]RQG95367.1 methylenetetrahydrofolate reductase [Natrarchaeobius chitinivorans]